MKKIILLIISLIFLTGCGGLYNLNDFVLPDDVDFINTIKILDTPKKTSDYMKENFTYKENIFYSISPYAFWKIKIGDCDEFANFGSFAANFHKYPTWLTYIYSNDSSSHVIAVYKEEYGYSFTSNQFYYPKDDVYYNNFFECVDRDFLYRLSDWVSYEVYDYWNNIVETGYNN